MHARHRVRVSKMLLHAQEDVEEQHADDAEREDRTQVARPCLISSRVDTACAVDALLNLEMLVAAQHSRHVVAQRLVHKREREDQGSEKRDPRPGVRHQNFSGSTSAITKKTVTPTDRISPITFAALTASRPPSRPGPALRTRRPSRRSPRSQSLR